jgi:hypothetical protein
MKKSQSDPDSQFFNDHPLRRAHIRKPMLVLGRSKQRSVGFVDENETEFRSMGEHDRTRRRILLYKVPTDNLFYDPDRPQILKIPFLLFADETVEDRDDILLPLIHNLMMEEGKMQGLVS